MSYEWAEKPSSGNFDIDDSALFEIVKDIRSELGFGPYDDIKDKTIEMAMRRAMKRTATTVTTRLRRAVSKKLGLKSGFSGFLRGRINFFMKPSSRKGDVSASEAKVWVGMNDIPVSLLKGRLSKGLSGAKFNGKEIPGSFIANHKGKRSIWIRVGSGRMPIVEAAIPYSDEMITFIDDVIFDPPNMSDMIEEIFFKYFRQDLRARLKYSIESKY